MADKEPKPKAATKPAPKKEPAKPAPAKAGVAAAVRAAAAPAKRPPRSPEAGRDIGLDVPAPTKRCADQYCPFHGHLPVRGEIIRGVVVSAAMQGTVVVARERTRFVRKYERYEKRTSRHHAHNPTCVDAKEGDMVTIAECRPIAKTVAFVVVERKVPEGEQAGLLLRMQARKAAGPPPKEAVPAAAEVEGGGESP